MNEDQQRIALAEFEGYKVEPEGITPPDGAFLGRGFLPVTSLLPKYHTESAAVKSVFDRMTDDQRHAFRSTLRNIAQRNGIWFEEALVLHAPEALLKTLGLWQE